MFVEITPVIIFRGLLLCAKCRISASADLGELERRSDLLEGATQVGHARDGFLRLQDWDRVKDCLYLQVTESYLYTIWLKMFFY